MLGPANHPAAAYPSWLAPARTPFTVVAGPPGNGAREYIAARASDDDLVLDVEEIIEGLAGVPAANAGPEWIIPALERRNGALARLARGTGGDDLWNAAWLISPSPMLWQRDFWAQRGATIVLLDPGETAATIAARAAGTAERWVAKWYLDAAAPRAAPRGMPTSAPRENAAVRGYGSGGGGPGGGGKNHAQLRDEQLAREPHCRFCAEVGRITRANVLDHIKPFRTPEGKFVGKLWGDPKNHRSLCTPCHDARGATRSRAEKPPGAGVDGRPLDPAHPWSKRP